MRNRAGRALGPVALYVLGSRCIVGASETQLFFILKLKPEIQGPDENMPKITNSMPLVVNMERMKQGVVQTCMERVVGPGCVLMLVVVRASWRVVGWVCGRVG